MNKDLQARVMALKQDDDETRARLVTAGTLYDGYNREMEAVTGLSKKMSHTDGRRCPVR